MNRLMTRLVLSHLWVAVLGAAATYTVVRVLAPALFDRSLGGLGAAAGPGQGQGTALRETFADAVDGALIAGALVGVATAAVFGVLSAYRLLRPLNRIRAATRRMAAGEYEASVVVPRERELADVVHDVNALGSTLARTEQRRMRLLGEVAHEMRTPLTVINGLVEGMTDDLLPRDEVTLAEIGDEVRRLTRLATDLSALSRAEEHGFGLSLATGDLSEVVHRAVARLRAQGEAAQVTLHVEETAPGISVTMDADRVTQVVTNLVGNALRATPRGGRIEITVGMHRGRAEVTVSDTGIGLAPEDLERVFERFFRLLPGSSEAGESGSGIGLTIARAIMREHGGDLSAASAGLGRGAVFTAWLPLSTDHTPRGILP